MPNFIFNDAIPDAANNPSFDQPDMKTNNISTNGILAIDHVSFNTNFGGNHLQVHLSQFSTSNAVVNGNLTEGSVVYSAAGVADPAHAQLNFKTDNGTFLLSGIRAFASVDSAGVIIATQSSNIASVVRNSAGIFTITLTANAVTSDKFLIFISSRQAANGNPIIGNYVITGIGTFQLQFLRVPPGVGGNVALADPVAFSVSVIQI